MAAMINPTDGMLSFQQALSDGEIDVERCTVNPEIAVYLDRPAGQMRLTYVRLLPGKIVQAMAIFAPVEPIGGLPTFQVGYAVPSAYRGNGFAKAIVKAGIAEMKHGFARNGMKTFWIEAVVAADNDASQRVAAAVLSRIGKATTDAHSGVAALQYTRKVE